MTQILAVSLELKQLTQESINYNRQDADIFLLTCTKLPHCLFSVFDLGVHACICGCLFTRINVLEETVTRNQLAENRDHALLEMPSELYKLALSGIH